jgi:hypothetical protein
VVLGGYFATLAGMRKPYPTDLSDAEWECIEPHLPAPKGRGRPRVHNLREILNAVPTLYVIVQVRILDDAQGGRGWLVNASPLEMAVEELPLGLLGDLDRL